MMWQNKEKFPEIVREAIVESLSGGLPEPSDPQRVGSLSCECDGVRTAGVSLITQILSWNAFSTPHPADSHCSLPQLVIIQQLYKHMLLSHYRAGGGSVTDRDDYKTKNDIKRHMLHQADEDA